MDEIGKLPIDGRNDLGDCGLEEWQPRYLVSAK